MTTELGTTLLGIAHATIADALGSAARADESVPRLHVPGASFVTLTQQGALRGCIGTLEAHRSLLADVKANALAAAFRDPRFEPLQHAELEITEVEVSLLSAIQPIAFTSEADALAALRPGIDGVVLEYRHYRSTFLPQVWEQLPEPGMFLAQLKRKAGLPADFWVEDIRLSCYSVSKWRESELWAPQ